MAFSMNGYWKKAFLDCDYDCIPYHGLLDVCIIVFWLLLFLYGRNGEE